MSKYRGNHDRCPHCGVKYKDFRTGFSYYDVFLMYWSADSDPNTWKYKRRSTVLGKWHQIKKELWEQHLNGYCVKELEDAIPF